MKRLIPMSMVSMLAGSVMAATPATPDAAAQAVEAFAKHPTHCEVFLGSGSRTGDAASAEYAQALGRVIATQNVPAGEAIRSLRARCEDAKRE